MISVHEAESLSLKQIEKFLAASKAVRFESNHRVEVYGWIERLLCEQEYMRQARGERGLLRRYIAKMTGLSRAQVTRLLARYMATGQVRVKSGRRHRFPQRYTRADIELLAKVDEAHEGLSGPATRRILQRAFHLYGKPEFERLARDLERTLLQPAPPRPLSPTTQELPEDAANDDTDRRAPSA